MALLICRKALWTVASVWLPNGSSNSPFYLIGWFELYWSLRWETKSFKKLIKHVKPWPWQRLQAPWMVEVNGIVMYMTCCFISFVPWWLMRDGERNSKFDPWSVFNTDHTISFTSSSWGKMLTPPKSTVYLLDYVYVHISFLVFPQVRERIACQTSFACWHSDEMTSYHSNIRRGIYLNLPRGQITYSHVRMVACRTFAQTGTRSIFLNWTRS